MVSSNGKSDAITTEIGFNHLNSSSNLAATMNSILHGNSKLILAKEGRQIAKRASLAKNHSISTLLPFCTFF